MRTKSAENCNVDENTTERTHTYANETIAECIDAPMQDTRHCFKVETSREWLPLLTTLTVGFRIKTDRSIGNW